MRVLDIAADGATSRLIALAQGAQAGGLLPKDSARTMVGMAKAVRAFAVARESTLVTAMLDDLDTLMATAEEPVLVTASLRATAAVRTAFRR